MSRYEEAAIIGVDPEDIAAFDVNARKYVEKSPADKWLLRRVREVRARDIFDPLKPSPYTGPYLNREPGFDIIGGVNDG